MVRSYILSFLQVVTVGVFAIQLTGCQSKSVTAAPSTEPEKKGYLVIAHGSVHHHDGHPGAPAEHGHHHQPAGPDPREEQRKLPWEKSVLHSAEEAAAKLDGPVEVAFGMWDHIAFQRSLDKLAAKGVTGLRVIPLFVNSNSSVVRGQKYQFGVSETPLAELPHLTKVKRPEGMRIEYGQALDESKQLTRILTDRARELSKNPVIEELILVAHGPVSEEENVIWLETLKMHAALINKAFGEKQFAAVHVISLRDDAERKVRDGATQQFRAVVSSAVKSGRQPLVLPVLIASGGIDRGIATRLKGLRYRYLGKMIAPDPELANWIVDSATAKR